MQYRLGEIVAAAGSPTVDAAWRAFADGIVGAFAPESPLRFLTSGGTGVVLLHAVRTTSLIFELDSGSPDAQTGETVEGPGPSNPDGGAATSGGGGTLDDSGQAWSADQYNGDWVLIRAGESDQEWRRITDTTATQLTVAPNWDVAPSASDSYGIYSNQQGTLVSFAEGTPQDFAAAGVVPGQAFVAGGEIVSIDTVTPRRLTLVSNFQQTLRGAPFGVSGDRTARSYLILAAGDRNPNSILGNVTSAISADVEAAYNLGWQALETIGWTNGWADAEVSPPGAKSAYVGKDHRDWVRMKGRAEHAGATAGLAMCSLPGGPTNLRPKHEVEFVVAHNGVLSVLRIQTGGDVIWVSGGAGEIDLSQVSYEAADA